MVVNMKNLKYDTSHMDQIVKLIFKKIFVVDPEKRITIEEVKRVYQVIEPFLLELDS